MEDLSDLSFIGVENSDITEFLEEVFPLIKVYSVRYGPKSYSNRLWSADTSDGILLVRIPGRTKDPDYVRAGIMATELAREVGIPTVQYVHFTPQSRWGLPVLIQEFRPGENATTVLNRDKHKLSKFSSVLGDWMGKLHNIRRSYFGSVIMSDPQLDFYEVINEQLHHILSKTPEEILPTSREKIERKFHQIIGSFTNAESASLIHGDVYFDNVLIHDQEPVALLDFEHANFHSRFIDFGKIEELLFEWWPNSREPFLEAYRSHFPSAENEELCMLLSSGFYALSQTQYFSRWQPELAPEYSTRLNNWMNKIRGNF